MTTVRGPARPRTSASAPTATNRSPRTAKACASRLRRLARPDPRIDVDAVRGLGRLPPRARALRRPPRRSGSGEAWRSGPCGDLAETGRLSQVQDGAIHHHYRSASDSCSMDVTMTKTERPEDIYTLWGGPLSLYSGKARSYLIKKRIPYVERFPSHPDFPARVMPAIGLFVDTRARSPRRDARAGHDPHFRVPRGTTPGTGRRPVVAAAERGRVADQRVRLGGPAAGGHALPLVLPPRAGIVPESGVRPDPAHRVRARCQGCTGNGRDAADEQLPAGARRYCGDRARDRGFVRGAARDPRAALCESPLPAGRPAQHRGLRADGAALRAPLARPVPVAT